MATLILEDGSRFEGTLFGRKEPVTGEVVFSTGMSGYQETLTDPAYCGQIVCMTYPLIGNVGINDLDFESDGLTVGGLIVSELCELPSNWQTKTTLDSYMDEQGVTGLYGMDTRALTRHLRTAGAMRGRIACGDAADEDAAACRAYDMHDQVQRVTCKEAYEIEGEGDVTLAVLDLGMQKNFTKWFVQNGCKVRVYPASASAQEILCGGCDGVIISAGPGDPHDLPKAAETAAALMEKKPVLGVGLGHLVMALSQGCKVEKMRFGHHGSNQPVKDLARGTCAVTSQAIGYAVAEGGVADGAAVSHINWNDRTIEGLRYEGKQAFSVQFIPGTTGGAFDTTYLYEDFLNMVRAGMAK
ncbi:MAG: glutamine-hydrolyzing carbamoyl-phosphate synthase small subunit [Clostridia bacterium]|nr:glutamine-hydrolyzing carbamoyl-phosphate synthase small subunit [Clostridia bacterium]